MRRSSAALSPPSLSASATATAAVVLSSPPANLDGFGLSTALVVGVGTEFGLTFSLSALSGCGAAAAAEAGVFGGTEAVAAEEEPDTNTEDPVVEVVEEA